MAEGMPDRKGTIGVQKVLGDSSYVVQEFCSSAGKAFEPASKRDLAISCRVSILMQEEDGVMALPNVGR